MLRAALALSLLCAPACGAPPPRDVAITVGSETVHVRVARRAAERRRGLKGVASLAADEGMLFVYRRPGTRTIWMQGCRTDLDVAFLDEGGRVLQVDTLRAPAGAHEAPQRTVSRRPAVMVLELPAGWFARRGLGVGTTVTLPPGFDRGDADP